jgi:hypothetical protein
MAPTPFTAAEIRRGCTPGRTVTFRVTEGTGPPRIETTRFVSCDEQGALMEKTVRDREGSPVTDQRSFTATWGDLQWHAAFEASRTSVTNESLVSEMGVFDCLRYTVRGEDGTADYWFAIELPGMPVRVRAPGLEMDVLENIN